MEEPEPLYAILFNMTMMLCDVFHGIDPIRLREYKCKEVFLLAKRVIAYTKYKQKQEKRKDMRPAGDDWF